MPKDAKKNVDRYKIRGGDLNEFEFSQNQAALVKESFPGSPNSPMPMKGSTPKGMMAQKTTAKKSAKVKASKKTATTQELATTKKAAKKTTAKKSAKKATKTAKKSAKK